MVTKSQDRLVDQERQTFCEDVHRVPDLPSGSLITIDLAILDSLFRPGTPKRARLPRTTGRTISWDSAWLQLPLEERMSKYAIRLLTLAVFVTVPVVAPMVTPAKAETSNSTHIRSTKRKSKRVLLQQTSVGPSGVPC